MPTGMKICLLVPSIPPDFAGGGKLAYDQARYMASRGESCTIVTKTRGGREAPNLRIVRIPQLALGPRQRGRIVDYLSLYPRFLRILAQIRPDVVHVMSADAWTLLGVAAAKSLGLPVVLETSLAGSDDPLTVRASRFGDIKFDILCEVDAIISVSPLLDELAAEAGFPHHKRHLIGNLVDVDLFRPADSARKAALRDRLGLARFEKVILYVGAIIERKRVLEVVRAFAALPAKLRLQTGLAVVGPVMANDESPRYLRQLEEYVRRENIEDRVLFTGGVDNVHEWMAACDVFAFASIQEGFGTVVVEAMASGLPVVVRRIAGISDFIVTDGSDGYITDSQAEFVDRIRDVLGDDELHVRLSTAARETARERFGAAAIADAYLRLFETLAVRTPGPGNT